MNGSNKRKQLAKAHRNRFLVRFSRPFEPGTVNGYVLGIGPKFFLLALVSDGIRLNGFQCFRLSDVRELCVPDEYAAFHEAALRKRGQRFPKKPSVNLGSLAALLLTAGRAFPLVTIHRENVDRDVCWIGRVTGVRNSRVTLREIGPDALWDDQLGTYRLGEITRVDFGGDYEDALYSVAGAPKDRTVEQSNV